MARPNLYMAYTIQEFVVPSGNSLHDFADDHEIKNSFKESARYCPTVLQTEGWRKKSKNLEVCLQNIKTKMVSARLKLNEGKMEFLQLGSRQQLSKCESINVNGCVTKNVQK